VAAPAPEAPEGWLGTLFAGGRDHTLAAGEALFHAGDPVASMALVLAGRVQLLRPAASGAQVILQNAVPGAVVSEAAAYAAAYHCDARSPQGARVRLIARDTFRTRLRNDPALAEVWAESLARSVQAARLCAEVRSLRTVGARLDAWLGARAELPDKGGWADLAAELGVTPEALYRELARRRVTP
jgi:CRP-like cAMP-binding protein